MLFQQRLLIILLALTLTACAPAPTITITATFVQIPTVTLAALPATPIPTFSPIPTVTLAVLPATPTPTISPTPTLSPTHLPTKPVLPSSLPEFPLERYVVLFMENGNLFFQDEENVPIKLTYIGERYSYPYTPKMSYDNQKVVFSRENGNIYSINTDGTQEHIIIPNDWLNTFDEGTKINFLDFIPSTHLVFLETLLCNEPEITALCFTSVFLVDTDTSEIRKLADLGLAQQIVRYSSNIRISPDGKMLAVGTTDGIKILTLDGEIIRQDILPYTPSSTLYPPFLPTLSWLPDSKGLIIAIPDTIYNTSAHGDLTAHTLWRYVIENNSVIQIPLEPPPWSTLLAISPNGNWIVYGGYSDPSLYLGNLATGNVQILDDPNLLLDFSWSSNSQYLIVGWGVITSFDKPPVAGGAAPRWMDANHYIHDDLPSNNPNIQEARALIAEIREDEIIYYELGFPSQAFWLIKPKQ